MQRQQSKQDELTEEEEMKQQQRMVMMKDLTRKTDRKKEWKLRTAGGRL